MTNVRRIHVSGSATWLSVVLGACAASPHVASTPREERVDRFRPEWTVAIPLHMDEVRACLEGRQPPVAVVHLQELATGDTGVTAVDGFGSLENCAARSTSAVMRGPSQFRPEDMDGLPLFVPGTDVPHVPAGVVLEEVLALDGHDAVLGWLYWPEPRQAAPAADGLAGAHR